MIMIYKIIINDYLLNMLQNLVATSHSRFTRQSHTFRKFEPRHTSTATLRYAILSSVKVWSKLPHEIRNVTSLNMIKNHIKKQNIKGHVFYYEGTRMGQILHARLNRKSSSLNEYLFLRNRWLICRSIHSVKSSFLYCSKYDSETIFSFNFLPSNLNNKLS